MNGIYEILKKYLNDIKNNHELLFLILSEEKRVMFSVTAIFDDDTIIFKTMNAIHSTKSQFDKKKQLKTYVDSLGKTFIIITIS